MITFEKCYFESFKPFQHLSIAEGLGHKRVKCSLQESSSFCIPTIPNSMRTVLEQCCILIAL